MSHFTVLVIGENVDEQLAPYQENNMGDCPNEYLEFVEDDGADVDEKTGKNGYWENPNRKWDWWEVGGRWSNMLTLNSLETSDSAKIKDINFKKMKDFCTFAVVKDGKWHERGEMGWFGVVSNAKEEKKWKAKFKKLLKNLDPETTITVVDCHI